MSFTGTFRHAVDAKGRLIVPSRVRDQFGGEEVMLTIWLEDCIAMWSPQGWDELEQSLRSLGRGNPNARALQRKIAAFAHPDRIDKQGRITVPQNLRDAAGITRDVVVSGALTHAELWNPDAFERVTATQAGQMEDLAASLDF